MTMLAACLALLSNDFLICQEKGRPVQICISGEPCKPVNQVTREWRRDQAKYRADMSKLYGARE